MMDIEAMCQEMRDISERNRRDREANDELDENFEAEIQIALIEFRRRNRPGALNILRKLVGLMESVRRSGAFDE